MSDSKVQGPPSFARALVLGSMLSLMATATGCKNHEASENVSEMPAAVASAPPVDHLANGELVEGKENAFGLLLPRDAVVTGRFYDVVYATVRAKPQALSNYVRARVREGTVASRDDDTVFEHVKMPGQPGLELRIRIDVNTDDFGSRLEIRDATPPPPQNLPDDEARWRAVGLNPRGEVLDPTHLQ